MRFSAAIEPIRQPARRSAQRSTPERLPGRTSLNYTRDGGEYWAHVDFQPIRSASGALTSFMAICTDLTERKRAQDVAKNCWAMSICISVLRTIQRLSARFNYTLTV